MTLGTKVPPDARIDVDGVATHKAATRYVLLNKPKGIVSTAHDERGRKTVVDVVGAAERLYPVGRLDTDSEGMVLLTNDGEWAERVLHPRFGHEREYDVSVTGELTPDGLAQLRNGIRLEEGLALAARIEVRSRSRNASRITMVLHTGWRRQIRRMLSSVGLRTVRLVRVRVGNLPLGKLREGEWRELTPREIADLARPAEKRAREQKPVAAPKPELRRGSELPRSRSAVRAAPRRSVATGFQGVRTPGRVATARGPSAQRSAHASPPPALSTDPARRPASAHQREPRSTGRPSPATAGRPPAPAGSARRPASAERFVPQAAPTGPSGSRARRTTLSQPAAVPSPTRGSRGPGRPATGGRQAGTRPPARGASGPVRRAGSARPQSRPSAPARGSRPGAMPARGASRPVRRPPAPYGVRRGPVRAKVAR